MTLYDTPCKYKIQDFLGGFQIIHYICSVNKNKEP